MHLDPFDQEVALGRRYTFGENWARFLELLDETRIAAAVASLRELLGVQDLAGRRFLDIGSGSGLFSLAARRLGARVYSFDYDPSSVGCTAELRRRFAPDDGQWTVARGSVLDPAFMAGVPSADIVYSWGVLHHTGQMHEAIRQAALKVEPGGLFALALYRKTWFCGLWKIEKRLFSRGGPRVQAGLRGAWIAKSRLAHRLRGQSFEDMVRHYAQTSRRGMDYHRDVDDWLGGYPYESITPPACRRYLQGLGFSLVRENALTQGLSFADSSGCDEWVFRRATDRA